MIEDKVLGALPEWDLSGLYSGVDDPQIENDIKSYDKLNDEFVEKYKGKVASFNSEELYNCIKDVESIANLANKLMIYAMLMSSKDQQKYSSFRKKISERLTNISIKTKFFELELAKTPIDEMKKKIDENPKLEMYRVMLEQSVKMQPHLLSEDTEQALLKKSLTGRDAWVNFFDELDSRIRFEYRGAILNLEEILNLRSNPDRNVREAATKAFYKGLQENLWIFTYITNTLSQDKTISDEMRNMPTPLHSRNMSNNISDEVVEAMNSAINKAYPRVSHRYYEILRRMLGVEKLKGWDRNAPIREVEEEKVPFDKAKEIVLDSYNKFSPKIASIVQKFFDNNWIDAPVTEGKRSGAFSMEAVVGGNPYNLLNYLGSRRDIATMAHELGHGVHQYLAEAYLKSDLVSDTPLTIAETASVFGERITFENILSQEKNSEVRISLLAGKINDMINTVVRQNAFFDFEKELHAKRKEQGEDLGFEQINEIYLRTQKEALGPAFDLDDDYGIEWTYVSHFIHTPYYVYAYAFGDCLVNSLYQKYIEAENKQEFVDKYIHMLEQGGSKSPTDLVKDFGLNLEDPKFWEGGMKAIEDLIDKLEEELK